MPRHSPTPRSARRQVDFVDYFVAGESFFTKTQGGTTISGLSDLCGHTVAVEKGTTEQTDATTQGTKCKKAGKGAVTVLAFPDQNGANLALSSGRAQLGFADSPVAAYQIKKSNGQFKLVGSSIENAPYGLAVPKNSGLAQPMLAALKIVMKNGQYMADPHQVGNPGRRDPVLSGQNQRSDELAGRLTLRGEHLRAF